MALQRVPDGTPPCPPDVPEPQWARLILGGPKCQVHTHLLPGASLKRFITSSAVWGTTNTLTFQCGDASVENV